MPRLDFIDVSKWQGAIDWGKVASSGIVGAIAKATESTTVKDAQYKANRQGALDHLLGFASYHYLHHGNVAAQMSFYLDTAKPAQGERVVIDFEEDGCTLADLSDAVAAIRKLRPDVQITVYGASMLTDVVVGQDVGFLEGTSLWAARYSSNQPVVADPPWPYWTAWQYSDSGHLSGIDGDVDTNTFNGSPDACRKWFGPAAVSPIPPVPEPEEAVSVTTITFAGRTVIVSIGEDGLVEFWVDGERIGR